MTAPGVLPSFDADTAIAPAGPGRWRATVAESWFVEKGPNGGLLMALATRAMAAAVEDPERTPRSLTVHFLEPPLAGPLDIAATVERAGRTSTSLSLRLTQDGRTVALGLGVAAPWRQGQPEWRDARPPDVPGPAESPPFPEDRPGPPTFFANYEMRPAWTADEAGPAVVGGWMRTRAPRGADPVLLAALSDAYVPAAFRRMARRGFVPTIDLTVHWRSPVRDLGPHPWILGRFSTAWAAGGTWEEDGELWSEDGVLLAQSRQLAIVRAPR